MYKAKLRDRKEKGRAEQESFNAQEVISLTHSSKLIINREGGQELIQVSNNTGEITITIEVTEKGPVLRLKGGVINIQATEKFTVESPVIELKAEQELRLSSEGDLHQQVKRDSFNMARIQHITADLGNVNIKANDDVRLDGERVKLNCTD